MIDPTLSESRPLDESAISEESGDFSHSNTVDTVSEASLPASIMITKYKRRDILLTPLVYHGELRIIVLSGLITTVQRTVVTMVIS